MNDDPHIGPIERCPLCGEPGEVVSIGGNAYGPYQFTVVHPGILEHSPRAIANDPYGECHTVYDGPSPRVCTVRLQPPDTP